MNNFYTLRSTVSLAPFALLAFATVGCVDPEARFDEFSDRVPDAAVISLPDAAPLSELPDVTGAFLVSISPTIAPASTVQAYWEVTLDRHADGTGTATVTSTAVSVEAMGRVKVGSPTTISDIPVNTAGEFVVSFVGLRIPGAANAISGSDLMADVAFNAGIKDTEVFCGALSPESMVIMPLQVVIGGSTWGAIRVTPGAEGAALPPPLAGCPEPASNDPEPSVAPSAERSE